MKTPAMPTRLLAALAVALGLTAPVRAYAEPHDIHVTTDGNGSFEITTSNPEEEGMTAFVVFSPNEGYVFDACSYSPEIDDYEEAYSGWPDVLVSFTMPAQDVELEATFTAAVTVAYDANGGVKGDMWRDSRVIRKGQVEDFFVTDDVISAPAGMEYDGVEVDGVRYGPTDEYAFDHDVTVVYQWKEAEAPTRCTVVYDFNGGTKHDDAPSERNQERNSQEDVRFIGELADPPEGMAFDGIEVDGKVFGPNDTWTVPDADSVTVKFIWRELGAIKTIAIDVNGGTEGDEFSDVLEAEVGERIVVPSVLGGFASAPEGFKFGGFEVDGIVYKPGDEFVVPDKDGLTIKLIWDKIDGGDDPVPEPAPEPEPAPKPAPAPTVPATGDPASIAGLIAAAGGAAVAIARKRRF